MLGNNPSASCDPFTSTENGSNNKRKRRPAGTPDPDAEVVSLSPKTLLESDRYVCEICNQGFQRDQNLQMHRRRHKVPWKLLKRETPAVKKRVFVCPEPTCLHHDPCHALGDLVGIKKHFKRKHSNYKQWVCDKCSKGYAVQSDFKAHLKTCGTRGHSCDCGRVFSRVESFIEHQDACNMPHIRSDPPHSLPPACLSRTASSPSPSTDTNIPKQAPPNFLIPINPTLNNNNTHDLDLHLSTTPNEDNSTNLQLSIGSSECSPRESNTSNQKPIIIKSSQVNEKCLKLAMGERDYAEKAKEEAKREIELAEREFANAKRIRQQALAELERAQAFREHARRYLNSAMFQVTCSACKRRFQENEDLLALSYGSSTFSL
ncbi:hypothetical protein LguiA_009234 [Lonicera macranthoides]